MDSRPKRPSRPVATITCSSCGLQQPLSMDCAGCRKSFSLEELQEARSGGGPATLSQSASSPPLASSPTPSSAPSPTPAAQEARSYLSDSALSDSAPSPFADPPQAPAAPGPAVPPPPAGPASEPARPPVFLDQLPSSATAATGATAARAAAGQVFADGPSAIAEGPDPSDTGGEAGDVYDPTTAVHRSTSGSRYHIGGQADLSASDLIQEAFAATFANLLPVAIVTIIVSIPVLLYTFYLANTAAAMAFDPEGFSLGTLIFHALAMVVVAFLCQLLGSAALTHVIGRWLRDETVVLLDSIGVAVRSLGVLVVMLILQGIGVGIGFLLLIIPGIILAIGWTVAAPAVVIERLGVTESLARSWKLTQGNRLTIFFAYLILNVINWLVDKAANMAVSADLATTVEMVTALVFTALQAVLTALIYFKLLAAEEGVPIDQVPMSVDAR